MNQILFTGDKHEKSNIKNVITIFCIMIIVLSVFFIIQGVYALVKDKDVKTISKYDEPDIKVTSQGGNATIDVKHNKSINKLLYFWNDGEVMEIDTQSKMEINENIVVPNQDCTLNISIIDSDGVEYKKQYDIEFDASIDVIKPEINISAIPGKIIIEVQDNKEMAYITYKWNDEQEIKIEASGEDHTKIVQEIEVKKGKNTLEVVATDKEGNTNKEQKDILGASKPKVSVGKLGSDLVIKVTDEDEVTKVEYTFNGTDYTTENTEEDKKKFELKLGMKQGENVIKIKAYNKSGLIEEYAGKAMYQP